MSLKRLILNIPTLCDIKIISNGFGFRKHIFLSDVFNMLLVYILPIYIQTSYNN